jgi:hypothetical protein
MEKEMNFFDLCVAIGHAIGRGCAACGRLVAHMVRLTYRYWYVVVTILILAIAAALYYSRKENQMYKMNAVALLNGPSIQQFEQTYAPLKSGQMLPQEAAIEPFVSEHMATRFDTYRVIDCLNDEKPDYIDFKRKSQPTDTVKVQMRDRLCLQFIIKRRDMDRVPEIEKALLEWLNSNQAMQQSYVAYMKNLKDEVAFDHTQALKLDSLTSAYYFFHTTPASPVNYGSNGVNFYGDRRVRLFLDEIYKQHQHLQMKDYRLQLATAPVTLENHFSADPKVVNSHMKSLVIFFLLGWIFGCSLAALIDKRKAILEWLKQ